MKLLKHEIIDADTRDARVILGPDLEKAFDNLSHDYILDTISNLDLGTRLYAYTKPFLSDRTATLRLGEIKSQKFKLGRKGTPQGSVISPTLFNLALAGLGNKLDQIENVKYTIYADDVTLWIPGGSLGSVENALQQAMDAIEEYLAPTGLRCSPAKSELLVYNPSRSGPKPKSEIRDTHAITLRTKDGGTIPHVRKNGVLGMLIESNGSNAATVAKIATKSDNAMNLIRRVANRQHGLKEENFFKLTNAFALCHFTYEAAMHKWKVAEKDKLNAQLRKLVKLALGIPKSTGTELLLQLGVHNTLEEIAEAQERAQLSRLSRTKQGRKILAKLGHDTTAIENLYESVPTDTRKSYTVRPLPRNMNPAHHQPRRLARGSFILREIRNKKIQACFVDAAQYLSRQAFVAITVNKQGQVTNALTVKTHKSEIAEQVAIALVLTDPTTTHVYSDSRSAVKAFLKGAVARQALHIINTSAPLQHHTICWFPAHLGKIEDAPPNLTRWLTGARET
ncbi:uncharacterized protein LOC119458896 [Dermacentor silvarum]|uniref:uncharacterized protein LOC119458896 n=1 Tax=Dermacentor silvarum TaxID=543639 RepID=UPI001898FDC4|nr:uncharacterized protein LOC119458896 [Dermacentor silvarum]